MGDRFIPNELVYKILSLQILTNCVNKKDNMCTRHCILNPKCGDCPHRLPKSALAYDKEKNIIVEKKVTELDKELENCIKEFEAICHSDVSMDDYIESISTPTGYNFYDLLKDSTNLTEEERKKSNESLKENSKTLGTIDFDNKDNKKVIVLPHRKMYYGVEKLTYMQDSFIKRFKEHLAMSNTDSFMLVDIIEVLEEMVKDDDAIYYN